MDLEAASIGPERIQYHPAVHSAWQRGPIQCQTLRGADWRDPFTGREGSRLLGTNRIRRLGQFDETLGRDHVACIEIATALAEIDPIYI